MANSLVYVDKLLVVPMAAKIVGSSITVGKKGSVGAGFDWFASAKVGFEYNQDIQANIVDFFAEDIFQMAYKKMQEKNLSVKQFCANVQGSKYALSDIASINGMLDVPGVSVGRYDPYDPPEIVLPKTYKVNGMDCFAGRISADGFVLPVYFPVTSKEVVCYCIGKAVEIVGVMKWSPAYEVSAYALNQTILTVALLLQR